MSACVAILGGITLISQQRYSKILLKTVLLDRSIRRTKKNESEELDSPRPEQCLVVDHHFGLAISCFMQSENNR